MAGGVENGESLNPPIGVEYMSSKFSFQALFTSVSKLVQNENVPEQKQSPQQQSHQQEIENSVLVLAADVIRCDKNLDADTEQLVLDFLAKQFGEKSKGKRLQVVATHIETGTEPFTKIACKELKLLTTPDSRLSIVRFLFCVAAADDFVNAKESRCIHRIAGYLGVSDKDFKELKRSFLSANSPHAVLEIDENSTIEEVKAAYRKMVLKYHPDKREKTISEEHAAAKFREIQKAFETIRIAVKRK